MKDLMELIEIQRCRFPNKYNVTIPEENFIEVMTNELGGFTSKFLNPIIDEVNKQGLLYSVVPQSDMRLKLIIFPTPEVCTGKRNKGMAFYGKYKSGKKERAREIANGYNENEVVWINYRQERMGFITNYIPWVFQDVTKDTKLIILDNVGDYMTIERFIPLITASKELCVNSIGSYPFNIELPDIIFVFDEEGINEHVVEGYLSRWIDTYKFPNKKKITFSKLKF